METLFYVIVAAVKNILVISLLLLFVAYMTLVERKVLGRVRT
jgi:NADH:ubiquinone oxidoreductase subunit H